MKSQYWPWRSPTSDRHMRRRIRGCGDGEVAALRDAHLAHGLLLPKELDDVEHHEIGILRLFKQANSKAREPRELRNTFENHPKSLISVLFGLGFTSKQVNNVTSKAQRGRLLVNRCPRPSWARADPAAALRSSPAKDGSEIEASSR